MLTSLSDSDVSATLHAMLDYHIGIDDHKTALIWADGRWSFKELGERSLSWSRALIGCGIGYGDRVTILGRCSPEIYAGVFGASRIGAVAVIIDPLLPEEVVLRHIMDTGSLCSVYVDGDIWPYPNIAHVVTVHEFLDNNTEGKPGTADPSELAETREKPSQSPLDAVVQLYSSGTTGVPKGIVLTHWSFSAIAQQLALHQLPWITWHHDDVAMCPVPSTHIGGLWWVIRCLHEGITTVLVEKFIASHILELIHAYKVSAMFMPPSLLAATLREAESSAHPERMRLVIYGGSPPVAEDLLQIQRDWNCGLAQIYGLTETGCTAVCLPPHDLNRDNIVNRVAGRPYPGVQLRIIAEDGHECALEEFGEVWINTPARMLEYWNRPDLTQYTIVDGWIRTGDLGKRTEEGFLVLGGRVKELIIVGGVNVFPEEVDVVLQACPGVKDVAVTGVPDPDFGEVVLACVVLEEGSTVRDFMRYARGKMESSARPVHVRQVQSLPRTASGKVQREKLKEFL